MVQYTGGAIMCTRLDRGAPTRPEAPPPRRDTTQATMENEPDIWALPPSLGFFMPRSIYKARVPRIGQETRNMKDGSSRLGFAFTEPKEEERILTCFTGIDTFQDYPKK